MSTWFTIAVPTRWLEPSDDLGLALAEHLPALEPGDTIVISEKVAVLLTGGAVPISSLHVGPLARFLAERVQPRVGSRGLSVPAKMQYVVQTLGRVRVTVAVLCAGFTRPLGHRGAFYRVAGSVARDLDGARPPYDDLLIPPMPVEQASELCAGLQSRFRVGVAIVDINDFGGSIRAASSRSLPPPELLQALSGNPLGQRLTGTPFGIVRHARTMGTDPANGNQSDQRPPEPKRPDEGAVRSAVARLTVAMRHLSSLPHADLIPARQGRNQPDPGCLIGTGTMPGDGSRRPTRYRRS